MSNPHVKWSRQTPPASESPPPDPPSSAPLSVPANANVTWGTRAAVPPAREPESVASTLGGSGSAAALSATPAIPVTPRFFSPPAPVLVCPTCHHRDTGDYCSRCGEKLVPVMLSVSQSVWEHTVLDRLVDALAFTKTTVLMIFSPILFFREVLQQNGMLAQRPFFLTGLWRRLSGRPQKVLDAVKYLILAYSVRLFVGWVAGGSAPHEELNIPAWVGDWAWQMLEVVATVLLAALYSFSLSLMLGGRVPRSALTRFLLYLNGLIALLGAALVPFSEDETGLAIGGLLVLVVAVGLQYLVLPRLFGITRRRLFAAQFGALALIVGAVALIAGAVAMIGAMAGLVPTEPV